jgi:Flp pilus assembly protein TadG
MFRFRKLTNSLSRYFIAEAGTTAVTFALSVVPLLVATGAAVDYMRYSNAETKVQAALDAGALAVAAAPNLSNAKRLKAGQDSFAANLKSVGIDPKAVDSSFAMQGTGVAASATYDMPTGLMQVAGLTNMRVEVETTISIPEGKKAEIALVLDYSGSMNETAGGQVKYVAMRNAAKKLVTDLEVANPKRLKVGLVPFSHHVYATLPEKFIVGKSGTGAWTGCTQDRRYPANLTDATPDLTDNATKWGHAFAKVHAADGCDGYAPNKLKVAPLTEDFDAMRAQLDAMRPYAWTHIALGAEFGYHLLSPNEPFAQGADYGNKNVRKVMVLLTDGRQTEPAFGNGVRTVGQGESNLAGICANAKASGITIITIAYDLRDEDTRARLRSCSTDPDKHFFIAEDGADVAAAFEDIKAQITAQVYISR